MDYLFKIQKSIDYIEKNLDSDIQLEAISKEAGFSLYHFHRIFSAIVRETLKEYIRKRRLTKAAERLINSNDRIIDIAFEYQFQSQESFTRAFKKMFGQTPGEYRKNKKILKLIEKPRLTEEILKHFQGGLTMEPKIITKEEFKVVGLKINTTLKENKIPDLWQEFLPRKPEIRNISTPNISLGVCEYVPNLTEETEFSYLVCVEVINFETLPKGMESKTIPTTKYAVFTHKGSVEKLGETYDYIYGTWLPKSNYQPDERDDFELYDERFLGVDHKDSETDIYIPIVG